MSKARALPGIIATALLLMSMLSVGSAEAAINAPLAQIRLSTMSTSATVLHTAVKHLAKTAARAKRNQTVRQRVLQTNKNVATLADSVHKLDGALLASGMTDSALLKSAINLSHQIISMSADTGQVDKAAFDNHQPAISRAVTWFQRSVTNLSAQLYKRWKQSALSQPTPLPMPMPMPTPTVTPAVTLTPAALPTMTPTLMPTPSATPTPTPLATLAPTPTPHVMLGTFSSYPGLTDMQSTLSLESQLGRHLEIDNHYYDWTDPFPGPAERADAANGLTPMITWWGINDEAIIDGSQDTLIKAHAAAIKAFARPVFLRWGAEMNGNWYAWSGSQNGNDPSQFVLAWRHIHDVFAATGVTNVSWVWAPNADSNPGGVDPSSWNNWANYYPGDQYVDWVGIDGYNWGGSQWQSFGAIFGPVYNSYVGRKPIMIAETGSVEAGGNKGAWVTGAESWMKSHGGVRAFVYFDTNQSSSGINWRIDSSSSSLAAFKALAMDPYFGG